jgi:hypothetical protein
MVIPERGTRSTLCELNAFYSSIFFRRCVPRWLAGLFGLDAPTRDLSACSQSLEHEIALLPDTLAVSPARCEESDARHRSLLSGDGSFGIGAGSGTAIAISFVASGCLSICGCDRAASVSAIAGTVHHHIPGP